MLASGMIISWRTAIELASWLGTVLVLARGALLQVHLSFCIRKWLEANVQSRKVCSLFSCIIFSL